jgi:hypothetical protein
MSDVVDLIVQDHRELQRIFQELRSDPSKRQTLAPVMSTLLFAHTNEFGEVLEQLIVAVTHHLEEEEESELPHLRERMSADELTRLGQAVPSCPGAIAPNGSLPAMQISSRDQRVRSGVEQTHRPA